MKVSIGHINFGLINWCIVRESNQVFRLFGTDEESGHRGMSAPITFFDLETLSCADRHGITYRLIGDVASACSTSEVVLVTPEQVAAALAEGR